MAEVRSRPPLAEFIADRRSDNYYSPDALRLEHCFDYVPVFVYGPEKYGFHEHTKAGLNGMPRIGTGYTNADTFQLFKYRKTSEPFALYSKGEHRGKMQGEVYLVPPRILLKLDAYHCNKIYNNRVRKVVHFRSDKDSAPKIADMWMYIGVKDMFDTLFDQGEAASVARMGDDASFRFYQWTYPMDMEKRQNAYQQGLRK
jgi:gamma-glutamylcyclotransferase (GGCT)/AIG2-like uncharacterized protein YtfP